MIPNVVDKMQVFNKLCLCNLKPIRNEKANNEYEYSR